MEIAGIGIFTAFAAGTVSFLSPCVLPLVPGYVSYVAGQSLEEVVEARLSEGRLRILGLGLCFVAGFSAVFMAFGAGASALGGTLLAYRYEANFIAGAIIVILGLHMMGILHFGLLNRDWRFATPMARGRPGSAFALGTAFAFGWTPCIGPTLGAILTLGAATVSVSDAVALLAIFSLGLAVPFLGVAAFTGHFMKHRNALRRIGRPLQDAAGGVLVLFGIAMVTGQLTVFSTWLLRTFPAFQDLQL